MNNTVKVKAALAKTDIVVDKALFEACFRCGVEPMDLAPRKPASFRRTTDSASDEKILAIRQEGFEQVNWLEQILSDGSMF